jgi:hypothetical protein
VTGRGVPIAQLPLALQAKVRGEGRGGGPSARSRGAQKRSGQSLEAQLAVTHAWYRGLGVAVLRQHHPKTVGPHGQMRYDRGAAPVDFGGVVRDLGSVLFDAKVVTGRATYEHEPAQFHQLEELRDHARLSMPSAPTRAFLFLADQDLGIAYLVEDLALPLARAPLPLRTGRGPATRHLWPVVPRAIARSAVWDWIPVRRAARRAPSALDRDRA